MTLRVTFDTNVLDLACRPERFPKDPRQPYLQIVREALSHKKILGFYSVTMLTIEGIMRKDRADVFESTQTYMQPETNSRTKNADLPKAIRSVTGVTDIETVTMNMVVQQPKRKPLHPEIIARAEAARALGVRVLKDAPRIGAYKIEDPDNGFYHANDRDQSLEEWIRRIQDVSSAIEDRGLGFAQIKALGLSMTTQDSAEVWFKALNNAQDIHEERAIERAFSEWADGDAIASHVAYGLDVFCSADVGNSNGMSSILDSSNRQWLTEEYGVKFMSFDDLLAYLS